jgi:hypothetical protein
LKNPFAASEQSPFVQLIVIHICGNIGRLSAPGKAN